MVKYGVIYDSGSDTYYYQGFGGVSSRGDNTTMEETTITNPKFDNKYSYGGVTLTGPYDLHPQHSNIGSIPDGIGGRVNKGCIGVCGSGNAGWGGVTDILFAAAGMDEQVGNKQKEKRSHLTSMLSKINLTVIVEAFSIPSNTPTSIKK